MAGAQRMAENDEKSGDFHHFSGQFYPLFGPITLDVANVVKMAEIAEKWPLATFLPFSVIWALTGPLQGPNNQIMDQITQ